MEKCVQNVQTTKRVLTRTTILSMVFKCVNRDFSINANWKYTLNHKSNGMRSTFTKKTHAASINTPPPLFTSSSSSSGAFEFMKKKTVRTSSLNFRWNIEWVFGCVIVVIIHKNQLRLEKAETYVRKIDRLLWLLCPVWGRRHCLNKVVHFLFLSDF